MAMLNPETTNDPWQALALAMLARATRGRARRVGSEVIRGGNAQRSGSTSGVRTPIGALGGMIHLGDGRQ